MRCEGEAAAGELLLTLVAFVQGHCGETELKTARDEYGSYLEKSRALKAKLAAEVKNFDPRAYLDKTETLRSDRFAQYGVAAACQAVEESGVIGTLPPERVAVYFGSGIGGIRTFAAEHIKLLERGPKRVSPYFIPMLIANMAAGMIAIRFDCRGAAMPAVTACASGTNAIGEAMRAIRHGYADAVIAGGAEAPITESGVAGFINMQALSTAEDPNAACIPFDKNRGGFVIGEGSAALVLEEYEHAVKRGAKIYGEVCGYGATCDAFHITAPRPDGTAGAEAADAFGNKARFLMMEEPEYRQAFLDTWKRIAARYKDNPVIYGYDLVNEPDQRGPAKFDYWTLQFDAAKAIRAIDPETPIIVESNNWCSPLTYDEFSPMPLKNIIYQIHMYHPGPYTHQGVGDKSYIAEYPRRVLPLTTSKEDLRRTLQPAIDFQKKYKARMFVGEFSVTAWAPGAAEYLRRLIELFEEYHWDWTYHAFREWEGWSVEHAGAPGKLRPSADNDRKRVLLEYFRRNQKGNEEGRR